MKRFIYAITILLFAASCSKEALVVNESGEYDTPHIEIKINATDLILTKAGEGDDDLRENDFSSLYCYIYPLAEGETKPAPGTDAAFCEFFTTTDASGRPVRYEDILRINLSDNDIDRIFDRRYGNSCFVYVVANVGSGVLPLTRDDESHATSYENICKVIIPDANSILPDTKQNAFVMEGGAPVQLISRTAKKVAEGTVEMNRVAAKTTIEMTVSHEVEGASKDGSDPKTKWTPNLNGMTVTFMYGVKNGIIDGTPGAVDPEYFNTKRNFDNVEMKEKDGKKYSYPTLPFYTYPMAWEPGEANEPYLMIMIPWSKDGGQTYLPSYYKLLLAGKEYVKNTWHNIDLTIGALGSWDEDTPKVIVADHYFVADWFTGDPINSVINDARYLIVPANYFEVKNLNTYEFKIRSTHDVEIANLYVHHRNLLNRSETDDVDERGSAHNTPNWVKIENREDGTYIVIDHTLVNMHGTVRNYDITPFDITFDIRHIGMESIVEHIEVKQYPAIYVEAFTNSDYHIGQTNAHKGYVYINNYNVDGDPQWRRVRGLDGTNKNPDMHVVTITALDNTTLCSDDQPYIIGESRDMLNPVTRFSQTMGQDDSTPSKGIGTYYGTNASTPHHIAPKFRIASSYGVCGNAISLNDAISRCAAYQEDGYPAGRWRVPSYAEFNFIVKLSGDQRIDMLFNAGSGYWTASGLYQYDSSSNKVSTKGGTTGFVRCVYDEWYWGSEQLPATKDQSGNATKFIWGNN